MLTEDFEQRTKHNGGYDRQIDEWKIIDVHQIPDEFWEGCGCDFYCCNDKSVYLLQLVNRQGVEKYTKVDDPKYGYPPYLIAELPLTKIDNDFILRILHKFDI